MGYNGGPYFTFSQGFSLFVDCKDQSEVDEYWNKLVRYEQHSPPASLETLLCATADRPNRGTAPRGFIASAGTPSVPSLNVCTAMGMASP